MLPLMLAVQEDSAGRREALRLETESELRRKKMELERDIDSAKLQVRSVIFRHFCA